MYVAPGKQQGAGYTCGTSAYLHQEKVDRRQGLLLLYRKLFQGRTEALSSPGHSILELARLGTRVQRGAAPVVLPTSRRGISYVLRVKYCYNNR